METVEIDGSGEADDLGAYIEDGAAIVICEGGWAGANDARACIQRAEAAGLCFEASVPALDGDWDGCEARSVSVTHRTCAGASAAPPCGAHWPGDAEPVQLSLNVDARGERSLIVGARTWTPVYATRDDSSSATRLDLEVAA